MLSFQPVIRNLNRFRIAKIDGSSAFTQREKRLRFIADELKHRTKNLLAVVQAVANQIGRRSGSVKEFQAQLFQRLQGLSRSIDLLVEEDGRGVSIGDLVRSHLETFGEVDGARISATGPELLLNPDATQNIGLALHELATNAMKHGALSVPEGIVTVHWELEEHDLGATRFSLVWEEQDGPEVMPPTRQGFGHIVLQQMTAATLLGTVAHEFDPRGVRWTLEAPAAAVIATEPSERACDRRMAKRTHAVAGGFHAISAH